ncbi:MAG: hypothetical protein LBD78_10835 [Spirochaetaceae bacterium]|jgi:HSP20 family molecular chaperone IbpA|nr:hypothetical protein [Spirochaetaceae bacterium]
MKSGEKSVSGRSKTGNYEKYREILYRERELAATVLEVQIRVKKAVLNREWTDFEKAMETLTRIGGEFEELDAKRAAVFEQEDGQGGFYVLAARLPGVEREELTRVYRALKLDIIRIKLENDTLVAYLNEARIMVAGFLEAIFPERKGRLYSRRGTRVEADMRSLVLNKRF